MALSLTFSVIIFTRWDLRRVEEIQKFWPFLVFRVLFVLPWTHSLQNSITSLLSACMIVLEFIVDFEYSMPWGLIVDRSVRLLATNLQLKLQFFILFEHTKKKLRTIVSEKKTAE